MFIQILEEETRIIIHILTRPTRMLNQRKSNLKELEEFQRFLLVGQIWVPLILVNLRIIKINRKECFKDNMESET
jgi:hypothetical protein